MTRDEILAFLDAHDFPGPRDFTVIESIGERDIVVRLPFQRQFLRGGNTISGPALMALADTAAYFLVLALAGPQPLAVTSSLSIQFLARPRGVDLLATAEMLRLGKRSAVSTVAIRCHDADEIVAHATVTYAMPVA